MATLREQMNIAGTPALSSACAYIRLLQTGSVPSFQADAVNVGGAALLTGKVRS